MTALSRRSLLASLLAAPAAAQGGGLPPPGLQLYTVRRLLAQDYDGTLARIAALGYREVEFAGLYAGSPQRTLAMLKRHGLTAPSGHASQQELEGDLVRTLATAGELGQQFVVCPSVDAARLTTLDDWKRLGDRFTRIGAEARRMGLAFAYHNHDFEFRPIAGQAPYDVLLAATDPALVWLEVDLYWMARAGRDPVDYFRRYPGRIPLLHLKDRARDGSITELGRGTIDFRRIFAHAALAGVAHGFVEHDDPADPMQSIELSLRALKQLGG